MPSFFFSPLFLFSHYLLQMASFLHDYEQTFEVPLFREKLKIGDMLETVTACRRCFESPMVRHGLKVVNGDRLYAS